MTAPDDKNAALIQSLLLAINGVMRAKGDATLLFIEQPNPHEISLIFRLPTEKQRWFVLAHYLLNQEEGALRIANQLRLKEMGGKKQLALAGMISIMLRPEEEPIERIKTLLSWMSAAPTPVRPLLKKIPIDPKDLEAFKPDPKTGRGAHQSFDGAAFIMARQRDAMTGK